MSVQTCVLIDGSRVFAECKSPGRGATKLRHILSSDFDARVLRHRCQRQLLLILHSHLTMALSNLSAGQVCSRRFPTVSIRSSLSPASLRQSSPTSRRSLRPAYTPPTFFRNFATESTGSTAKAKPGTIQISTLFTGLLLVGIGITAYGVYVSLSVPLPFLLRSDMLLIILFGFT